MDRESQSIIPVIDFSQYETAAQQDVLAKEICEALRTVGFLYLKNHGIPEQQIRGAFAESASFFRKDEEWKMQFAFKGKRDGTATAYVQIGAEQLNPSTRKEIREAFDLVPHAPVDIPECSHFIPTLLEFDQSCRHLAKKILHCIGLGLQLSDPHFFLKVHINLDDASIPSDTMFRSLYYPPYRLENDHDPHVVRLGTHSDYGTVTLLVQDQVGGLEVLHTDGTFVPATPIAGTVLVNIGDLLERWTSEELQATQHRVLCNDSQQTRQSLVTFVHPDHDTVVQALEGRPSKYPPINAWEHLQNRYTATYSKIKPEFREALTILE